MAREEGRIQRILVPEKVFEGIIAIRDSGATNMLDYIEVAKLCRVLHGNNEASKWIMNNKEEYAKGIFYGFVTTTTSRREM